MKFVGFSKSKLNGFDGEIQRANQNRKNQIQQSIVKGRLLLNVSRTAKGTATNKSSRFLPVFPRPVVIPMSWAGHATADGFQ